MGSRFESLLKRSRQRYALIGVTLLFLIPIVMAALTPVLAPIPSQASIWTAPSLPERDQPLPDFQHLLDPLPLIVRDLPDAASQNVIRIYDATSFTDLRSALQMVTAAEDAIVLPANLESLWRVWLNDPQSDNVPVSVMEYLQEDPLNADRLSNLAVTMYLEVLTRGSKAIDTEGSSRVLKALGLLDSIIARFPDSRAPILNLAYIDSLSGALSFGGTRSEEFQAWLMGHPDDATALQLSVNLYVNSVWNYGQDKNALQTRATAMSQSEDPARAAFGYTMLGDLELGDLYIDTPYMFSRVELAPYATMRSARLALELYDHALALSDDFSIYTARAFTQSLLGDNLGAIATQQRAVELLPESVTLQLLLADLYLQQRGTTEQIRESIEVARSIEQKVISTLLTQGAPRLSDFRPITQFGELTELASNRPEKFYGYYENMLSGGRGGGFVVDFDQIPLYEDRPATTGNSNPLEQAIGGSVLKSEALGDPDGVENILSLQQSLMRDANWSGVITPYEYGASPIVARLVADADELSNIGFQSSEVGKAASWLRFVGENEGAIDLCRAALRSGVDNPDDMHRCVAENAYLLGDYETSQKEFDAIKDDFMVGFVAERRGNVDEAIRRYEVVVESDGDTRDIAMLRLANVLLEAGDTDAAMSRYDEFLVPSPHSPSCVDFDMVCFPLAKVSSSAHSNRGIARLQALAGDNGSIDCEGVAWEACRAAFLDFDAALEIDGYNPVYLMNQAWVARMLGDPSLSAQLMRKALESDITIFPVLNDLGVFSLLDGDTTQAKQFFLDAAAINPHYDLALWNLGVLHMQEGVSGLFRGQAYLARAIIQNPSRVTGSLEFLTDERVYRVEINERLRPGANWSFGATSSFAAVGFGLVTFVVMILQATYGIVLNRLQDTLTSRVHTSTAWMLSQIPPVIRSRWNARSRPWMPLVGSLLVLGFNTVWIARHNEPNTAAASVVVALFAVVLAVATHNLGHVLVARHTKAIVQSTQWTPGTILALGLLPMGLSSGPFPGQKVIAANERDSRWVYLAGPLANLAVAILAYLLYRMQPIPGIRLISQVQLAAMGYALLPFVPLDGAMLAKRHPRVLSVLSGSVLFFGVLFTLGIL